MLYNNFKKYILYINIKQRVPDTIMNSWYTALLFDLRSSSFVVIIGQLVLCSSYGRASLHWNAGRSTLVVRPRKRNCFT